jgi:Asp-tRNA(Asn)/Glu-tRNA(Gln) amidotransferase A subunit family amidase
VTDAARPTAATSSESDPCRASAAEAAEAIRTGRLTSEALVRSCLAAVAGVEPRVGAWAFIDADHALAQARRADRARAGGGRVGPLHGVPVGVKDVFDTADMPTELGTPLHAGRRPATLRPSPGSATVAR